LARAQPAAPAYVPAAAPAYAAPSRLHRLIRPLRPFYGFFGGGMGSMLGTVAATAAGVAGGAFLYQGIEHLFNGNSGSDWRQERLSAPVENIENTTVNNYYGGEGDRKSDLASNDGGSGDTSGDLADSAISTWMTAAATTIRWCEPPHPLLHPQPAGRACGLFMA
jgi:hypothetical protein